MRAEDYKSLTTPQYLDNGTYVGGVVLRDPAFARHDFDYLTNVCEHCFLTAQAVAEWDAQCIRLVFMVDSTTKHAGSGPGWHSTMRMTFPLEARSGK